MTESPLVCSGCGYSLDHCECDGWEDYVEDWELLGMDPDDPQEEIDQMWENQM